MSLEERVVSLEGQLEKLTQTNEGLMIQVESLERDMVNKEKGLEDKELALAGAEKNLDWLLKSGVVSIIDQVIDCPEFTRGIGRMKQACLSAGEELGRQKLQVGIGSGTVVDVAAGSSTGGVEEINHAIKDFAAMDYASLLKLGQFGVDELKEMCRPYNELRATEEVSIGDGGAESGGIVDDNSGAGGGKSGGAMGGGEGGDGGGHMGSRKGGEVN